MLDSVRKKRAQIPTVISVHEWIPLLCTLPSFIDSCKINWSVALIVFSRLVHSTQRCVLLDRWSVVLLWVLIAPVFTHLSPSCAGVWGLWRRYRWGWWLMSPGFHCLLRSGARQFAPSHILQTRTFHFPHKGPFFINLIWILVNKSLPWAVHPFLSDPLR